jgi:cytochrome c oxidase subunit 1
MGWFDMPLFVWGIYATGVIQILATPVLAIRWCCC